MVDIYRSNRQFERFLLNNRINYQVRSSDELEEQDNKGELIARIYYDNENHTQETRFKQR